MIKKEVIQLLVSGTPIERKEVCRINPVYFSLYYFPEYWTFKGAPFHEQMYRDYMDLMDHRTREAGWIMFRESAKTSIAKICLIHALCYERKHYINVDSYDKENAESFLFDVVLALQTNDALKADFGELYNSKRSPDEVQKKRISDFVTNNGVRVEAHSTQESVRGRVYQQYRPDWFILDDFENSKTITSLPYTQKVLDHINEMLAGLSPDGSVLYLGNYISETGSVSQIMERSKRDNRVVVRNIPIMLDGVPTWPDKYVATDKELEDKKNKGKVSIEERRRMIPNFEAEMMNNPATRSNIFFDREKVERAKLTAYDAQQDVAGLLLWESYKPHHRYAIGADTSEGVGRDANTAAIIDFEYQPNRAAIIGTYANNQIAPDIFGFELVRIGNMFGACLIAPERNNTGHATIAALKQKGYPTLYQDRNEIVVNTAPTQRIGWNMKGGSSQGSKYNAFFAFKRAFEEGELAIFDERLLDEMLYYSLTDLESAVPNGMATRHYDLLVAAVIAWAMRSYASYGTAAYENDDYGNENRYMETQPF